MYYYFQLIYFNAFLTQISCCFDVIHMIIPNEKKTLKLCLKCNQNWQFLYYLMGKNYRQVDINNNKNILYI